MKDYIYLDHAATTPVDPRVVEAMLPYFTERFGNPSGVYTLSQSSQGAMEEARATVADVLGCSPGEVIFTGGASEADNAAIKGGAFAMRRKGNHLITSAIEHHAVLHSCQALDDFGLETTSLDVNSAGLITPEDAAEAVTGKTVLVTIMLANNEVGTIEPVADIARAVKEKARALGRDIIVHTDAAQA